MSVIQQVYLAESGSSIYIKGIKPDKENELDSLTRDSGIITKDIIKQCIYGKSSKQGL